MDRLELRFACFVQDVLFTLFIVWQVLVCYAGNSEALVYSILLTVIKCN